MVHEAPAFNVPPARVRLFDVPETVPAQFDNNSLGVAVAMPDGKVSVNAIFASAAASGFVIENVSVETPPIGIVDGLNAFVRVGAAKPTVDTAKVAKTRDRCLRIEESSIGTLPPGMTSFNSLDGIAKRVKNNFRLRIH